MAKSILRKKLYYLKYEVMATDIKDALTRRKKIYAIEEAINQPPQPFEQVGFIKKK